MAQSYLPAGPSVPKPALSHAQGPGDTHAHPMAPKTTRPQPAGTQPDLTCQQRTLLPNTIPPPSVTSHGGKRPPEPGFPWSSQPAVGDEVLARQASFSHTWHCAVVTATRTLGHRTSCDIRWDDGSHTRALPLSRGRAFPARAASPSHHTLHGALAPGPSCELSRFSCGPPSHAGDSRPHSTPRASRPTCAHRVTHFGATRPGSGSEHPDCPPSPSQLTYKYHVSFALAPE